MVIYNLSNNSKKEREFVLHAIKDPPSRFPNIQFPKRCTVNIIIYSLIFLTDPQSRWKTGRPVAFKEQ